MSSRLDTLWPPYGPCGLCGASDARHRVWDAILARFDGGEMARLIAYDYGVSCGAVVAVIQDYPSSDLYREVHRP